MKGLWILLACCCVSGCAAHRWCRGPMVPINRPVRVVPPRAARGARVHGGGS